MSPIKAQQDGYSSAMILCQSCASNVLLNQLVLIYFPPCMELQSDESHGTRQVKQRESVEQRVVVAGRLLLHRSVCSWSHSQLTHTCPCSLVVAS